MNSNRHATYLFVINYLLITYKGLIKIILDTSVIEYIKNQEIHHRKQTFVEEYYDFLKKFEIDFDERYIFKPVNWDND
jgi:hypothetical protein